MTLIAPAEPQFLEQTWDLSFRHALGSTVAEFMDGLRAGQLRGRTCPGCTRVLVPPRSFCDRCHLPTGEWVDVSKDGRLEMFTIVYENFPGTRVPAPYVLVYVLLDGADTAIVGYLRGLDLTDSASAAAALGIGTRVIGCWADDPSQMTDLWFELAET